MAKKKISLLFSKDKKAVQIVFEDGNKSDEYRSIEDVIDALDGLVNSNKISGEDATILALELLEGGNIPPIIGNPMIGIEIVLIGDENPFEMFGLFGPAMIMGRMRRPEKTTEIAYFEICSNCGKHGTIYGRTGQSGPLRNKKDGFALIELLKTQGEINDNESQKLTREITESTLAD